MAREFTKRTPEATLGVWLKGTKYYLTQEELNKISKPGVKEDQALKILGIKEAAQDEE